MLSGGNTYRGGTTINAGTLRLEPAARGRAEQKIPGRISGTDSSRQVIVNGGDLVLAGGADPAATLAATLGKIREGYASGSWGGTGGITSTAARDDARRLTGLAAAVNDDGSGTPLIPALSAVTSDVLVRYTYHGDANLDGRINADDYFLIDSTFLGQGAPLGSALFASPGAAVPEPAALSFLAVGLMALSSRRLRRSAAAARTMC